MESLEDLNMKMNHLVEKNEMIKNHIEEELKMVKTGKTISWTCTKWSA